MTAPRNERQVALAYPLAVPWTALFARGVLDYAEEHGGWSLTASPSWTAEEAVTLESLKGWPGDGIIATITNREELRAAKRLGKPVVNISGALRDACLPRVMPDHYRMGQMAAEHLLQRGLSRFACYGIEGPWLAQLRCRGFVDRLEQAGFPCDVLEVRPPTRRQQPWHERLAPLKAWLQRLRPPVGLLAVQDHPARIVMDMCQRLGLAIPHDVAVIGMDNDPTVCEYCRPTLSSVSRNAWRVGYETAALLEQLMQGRTPQQQEILLAPDGIVARQSTETIAMEDPHVATAAQFIHDHLGEPFNAARVVQAASVSRRQLEIRFRQSLGCSLYEYLCRQRVERSKRLLAAAVRPKLHKVACECGFSGAERFRLVFKRLTGCTPLQYRQECLAGRRT